MNTAIRIGTACGKVILLGEHAVVYGVPAIAVGIDKGTRATAVMGQGTRLRVPAWDVDVTEDEPRHELARAFKALLEITRAETGQALADVLVEVQCELPAGGGLGCSAATGVAIARALDPHADTGTVATRVAAWERIFHGNPSGIDAVVAAGGGCVQYEKSVGIETVEVRGDLHLCIGNTGIASSTKSMVDSVARVRARRPDTVAKAFEGIRALVRNARLAIEAGDRFALGRLLDLNQMLLSGLFVSTEEIERMCDLARSAGAYGAKLTGAGGGGSVVALVSGPGAAARVLESWENAGFSGFTTRVDGGERALDESGTHGPAITLAGSAA